MLIKLMRKSMAYSIPVMVVWSKPAFENSHPQLIVSDDYPKYGPHTIVFRAEISPHAARPFGFVGAKRDDGTNPIMLALTVPRSLMEDAALLRGVAAIYATLTPIWSNLSTHEHVTPVLAILTADDGMPVIVTPFYKNGNITEHNLRTEGVDKYQQLIQIAKGLEYHHSIGQVHANVCSENILVKDDGDIVISGARFDLEMRALKYGSDPPIPGNWRYKSPEFLLHLTPATYSSDVYAWACLAYEILCGRKPFHNPRHDSGSGIVKVVRLGHRALPRPSQIQLGMWALFIRCWAEDPITRPSMAVVLSELEILT